MKNLIIQTKKKMVRINSNLQKDNTQKIINSNNINSLVANVQPSKFAILKKQSMFNSEIGTSNHIFKREIWDKFTEFAFLKF